VSSAAAEIVGDAAPDDAESAQRRFERAADLINVVLQAASAAKSVLDLYQIIDFVMGTRLLKWRRRFCWAAQPARREPSRRVSSV